MIPVFFYLRNYLLIKYNDSMRFLHHTSKISKRYTDLLAHYRALTNIVNILCMLINVFLTCVFDVYLIAIQNRTYSNHDHQMSIITLADCFLPHSKFFLLLLPPCLCPSVWPLVTVPGHILTMFKSITFYSIQKVYLRSIQ